jgi:tetratricopeptide (TPR) repeat protein
MKKGRRYIWLMLIGLFSLIGSTLEAQINTDRVMIIGRNALYFEDYVLSIQYFNQVISAKPYLAEPYFFRAVAKLYLADYKGAEEDCSKALERNNFLVKAYLCRSYARVNLKDYQGVVDDCTKALEFEQDNQPLMQNKAVGYLYAKQYDAAAKSLDELLDRYPNYVNA